MYDIDSIINNQFEVRKRLVGGMGYVYIVFDQVTQGLMVIKMLKDEYRQLPEACQRFEREARAWINLSLRAHSNIVRAILFHRHPEPLLVEEYIDGPSLQQLLRSEPIGLALTQTVAFALQIARGLHHAHTCALPGGKRGVIHRDLKPGNVMITRTGVAKLADFGLAKVIDDSSPGSPSRVLGTVRYMPPEQFYNSHAVREQADIYTYGMMVYEMITGHLPFPPGGLADIMFHAKKTRPEPIGTYRADVPAALVELILHCLRKKPERRPGSIEDVVVRLEKIQQELDPQAEPHPPCLGCGYIPNKEYLHCPVCGQPPEPAREPESLPGRQCACGQAIRPQFRFCIHCGQAYQDTLICPTCTQSNPLHHRFCSQCGQRLTEGK